MQQPVAKGDGREGWHWRGGYLGAVHKCLRHFQRVSTGFTSDHPCIESTLYICICIMYTWLVWSENRAYPLKKMTPFMNRPLWHLYLVFFFNICLLHLPSLQTKTSWRFPARATAVNDWHLQFWPIFAQINFGFFDVKFFLVMGNSWNFQGSVRGQFEPKTHPSSPL